MKWWETADGLAIVMLASTLPLGMILLIIIAVMEGLKQCPTI